MTFDYRVLSGTQDGNSMLVTISTRNLRRIHPFDAPAELPAPPKTRRSAVHVDSFSESGWEAAKSEHKALSAAAAPVYDKLYESANFATGSYMRYEVDRIKANINHAPSRDIALDLGCGTGRDSLVLGESFNQVLGFDFSEAMVDEANKNKINARAGNISFTVKDVETEMITEVREDSVAFVNSGFGMGSFVRSPESLFREVRRVLMPKGIAIFSFYNSDALVNNLQLDWTPALAARVVPGANRLEVNFDGRRYEIPALAYRLKELKKRVEVYFDVESASTFPTLSALLPQKLFSDPKARSLCTNVDELLATNAEIAAGPYIIFVCKKRGKPLKFRDIIGYRRVLHLLELHQVPKQIKEHAPVKTMEDVKRILDVSPSEMVKTVLVAHSENEQADPEDLGAALYLCALPSDRKLSVSKLARILGKPRTTIRFATGYEVEQLTGFQVGAIPPFGQPKKIPVIFDVALRSHQVLWCGTGKSTESMKISREHLERLANPSYYDVSKPHVAEP